VTGQPFQRIGAPASRWCPFVAIALLATTLGGESVAQPSEKLALARQHRGKAIEVPGELLLPPGTGKVPAMVIVHGSGGVSRTREYRYANEFVGMGVAALVIDAFKPRGISATVSDQDAVSSLEMTNDAFAALRALAVHPRVEAARIGIVGFSKGGTVALLAAHERHAERAGLPPGLRFALHAPVYPACASHYLRPKTSGAPIVMLLGAADTYAGVAPCTEYAEKLKAEGAKIQVKLYAGAPHGFDGDRAYSVATGENWSRCIFEEQADGTWKERVSGQTTNDRQGKPIEAGRKAALAACRSQGVSGGPNAAAKVSAMNDLKEAVRRHLLDGM
jgi:dienelactone hydrolase